MARITSSKAEGILDEILSTNENLLAVLIIDESRGNVLASRSKATFRRALGVFEGGAKYGASLAVAALSVANEVREIAGEALTLITIYEKYKMMLLPLSSYEIVVGLVLPSSINAEDYIISNKIKRSFSMEEEERKNGLDDNKDN